MSMRARRLGDSLFPQQLSAGEFRAKAAHCFRLAVASADAAVSEQLRRLAAEFEARAAEIEAKF